MDIKNIFKKTLNIKIFESQKARTYVWHLLASASRMPIRTRFCDSNIFIFKVFLKIFFIFHFFIAGCGYVDSRAFKMAIENKNCEEAKNILLGVLKKKSDNHVASFNLVHTFMCAGDLVSAEKQVDALLRSRSPYLFELYFLKGYIAGEIGEIDDALAAYQKALDLKSDQRIKKNMELLLQDSNSGKSGKKKKGKGKKQKDSQTDKNSKDNENDPEQKNEDPNPNKPSDKDPKDQQSKKMTKKQTEKIMKEIDSEEKKVRSQGLKIKSKKGGSQNDKNW